MKHALPPSDAARIRSRRVHRGGLRVGAGALGVAAAGALLLGVGAAGPAQAAKADNHGCVVTSNGFTYNCETGMISWDSSVTIAAPFDTAVLFDASTKPQKRVAGPVSLPKGAGPGSAFLGTFACGEFQFDIATPGSNLFVAGHKGTNGPCVPETSTTTTPPETTTTTTPPGRTTTTTTPPETTTTTTTPPGRTTTTPPSSTESSAVLAAEATYSLAPVNAGAEVARDAADAGTTVTAAQVLLVVVMLVALWLASGAPLPRVHRSGRFQA